MNICHVNLATGFSGGERQTLQLLQQQAKLGYNLTLVANPKSKLVAEVKNLPCKIVLANHFSQSHSKSITDGCIAMHVHEGRAIYWALIQNLLHKTPYIVTRRIDNPLKNKWLSKQAYQRSSIIVGLSREIVRQVQLRHPNHRIEKIPSSPVSYSENKEAVAEIRQRYKDKFIVIQAANMLKHKGFNVTVEAARCLEHSHPNIQFCLLGDGKERGNLEHKAFGLSNLSFEGKQSNMGDWFHAADLLVHPSYSEGLGSVILEGMAARLPAIGSNAGGIPDIIDGEHSGLLITPGSAKELAEKIVLIETSPKIKDRLIAGAQKKLTTFKIEHTAKQYEQLYRQVGQ